MGALDQFIKEVFEEEIPQATQDSLRFEVPPELKTTELHADGMLYVVNAEKVKALPAPWSLIQTSQLVLEFKMQGDKFDRYQYERALLRRQAAQVEYLKQYPDDKDPVSLPLWIVTGQMKEWLSEKKYLLSQVAPACYRLEPASYEVYLIVSNELEPFREDLIPFLVARTGQKLVDFCKWFAGQRPELCEKFLEIAPMSETQYEEVDAVLREPDAAERARRRKMYIDATMEATGVKQEMELKGQMKTLSHMFEKRLARPLTEEERTQLGEKVARLGPDRVSDVVLELAKDSLAEWLPNPIAV